MVPQAAEKPGRHREGVGGSVPDATRVRGRPEPFTGPFLDPTWTANADRALGALGLTVRIGDAEEALGPLAAGSIRRGDFSDGARRFLSLAVRAPDVYHLHAIVHDDEGLIRANAYEPPGTAPLSGTTRRGWPGGTGYR